MVEPARGEGLDRICIFGPAINDRYGDTCCFMAKNTPDLQVNAASATCQTVNVGFVRVFLVQAPCSEWAVWISCSKPASNDRFRDMGGNAARNRRMSKAMLRQRR
jgi:hypothetical protein